MEKINVAPAEEMSPNDMMAEFQNRAGQILGSMGGNHNESLIIQHMLDEVLKKPSKLAENLIKIREMQEGKSTANTGGFQG